MCPLPFELWCLIFAQFRDDVIQVFKLTRVSKIFRQVAIYVLNHTFKIKLCNPKSIKKCRVHLNFVLYFSRNLPTTDYLFDLFYDSKSIVDIDIIYRFIRNFSTVVPKDWNPSPNNYHYLNRYYLEKEKNRIYICSRSYDQIFQSQKDCDECAKLLNQLEQKTTFIQNQNYCLLFNKFNKF